MERTHMDKTTQLASEAIVRAVEQSAVPNIVRELHRAAVVANEAIGREEAVQIMVLANAIEIDGEIAARG